MQSNSYTKDCCHTTLPYNYNVLYIEQHYSFSWLPKNGHWRDGGGHLIRQEGVGGGRERGGGGGGTGYIGREGFIYTIFVHVTSSITEGHI